MSVLLIIFLVGFFYFLPRKMVYSHFESKNIFTQKQLQDFLKILVNRTNPQHRYSD